MRPDWVSKYIGLEYRDAHWGPDYYDCWGLMSLIYREQFNIDIAKDMTMYSSRLGKITRLVEYIRFWEPVKVPSIGDGVLFLIGGKLPHCGVYIGDGKVLHSIEGISSCIQDINNAKWKSRFEGYYRYSESNS